jgi:predicted dithiol-disulfide oxidoreductase (DUF899 family)
MTHGPVDPRIQALEKQIGALREQITELRRSQPPQPVADYELRTAAGEPVKLSELFGDKRELFVIHNMGRGCPYCTLWADGFNGVLGHLENRAAFVVSTPDAPEIQTRFAASRGWRFRMVSTEGTAFAEDLGYFDPESGMRTPGVSVFTRDGDQIRRVSNTAFGPGDDYNLVWHMLDLLPKGADGWEPQFKYR